MDSSNNTELDKRRKLRGDFSYYAPKALKIRTKSGSIEPFVFNKAQRYLHKRLEDQKASIGYVRAIILKGRQQGCSTYVGGRFYHKTTNNVGLRTYILTHETDATANLFGMVERYYKYTPEDVKPSFDTSNRKELVFGDLESGYQVGTAGTKGVGRSNTVQLFHGSEVAFWPHAETHASGIMQTMPKAPGTEVLLESTANGVGNYYHQQWKQAEAGLSDFIAVFIPWYWQDEYKLKVPEGFSLEGDEQEYMETYGLTLEQIVWRRDKIVELGDELLFKQEYPATPDEAFQTTGIDSFIPTVSVTKARKNTEARSYGAVVAGYDPSEDGDDRDALIYRQGPNAFGLQFPKFVGDNTFPQQVAFCKRILLDKNLPIDMLFIDYGGGGWQIGGMLIEDGFADRVRIVNFGSEATKRGAYVNKRAEIWGEMKAWLIDTTVPASIPDDESLHADLVGPAYEYDSKTRILLESKKSMKARGLVSPDGGDSLALTFSEVIVRNHVSQGSSVVNTVQTKYDLFGDRR